MIRRALGGGTGLAALLYVFTNVGCGSDELGPHDDLDAATDASLPPPDAQPEVSRDGGVDSSMGVDADAGPDTIVQVSTAAYHTCYLMRSGRAYCVGRNDQYQLGDGVANHPPQCLGVDCSLAFVRVVGVDDAVEIGAGGYHTCVRRASGQVSCWGGNERGQLGDGTKTERSEPRRR